MSQSSIEQIRARMRSRAAAVFAQSADLAQQEAAAEAANQFDGAFKSAMEETQSIPPEALADTQGFAPEAPQLLGEDLTDELIGIGSEPGKARGNLNRS